MHPRCAQKVDEDGVMKKIGSSLQFRDWLRRGSDFFSYFGPTLDSEGEQDRLRRELDQVSISADGF